MKTNVKTQSGNRIVAVMDGVQFGLIQSVSMNDDYSPEPASGIGDIHVQEYVPTMARHSLSVSKMILKREEFRKRGISVVNGDAALQGLVFDFETYDKDTGDLLRKYTGCSFASGSVDVQKHAIVVSSAQFNALDVTGDNV